MASQQPIRIRRVPTRAMAILMAGAMVLGATGFARAATPPSGALDVARWQLALARDHANDQAISTLRNKVANAAH